MGNLIICCETKRHDFQEGVIISHLLSLGPRNWGKLYYLALFLLYNLEWQTWRLHSGTPSVSSFLMRKNWNFFRIRPRKVNVHFLVFKVTEIMASGTAKIHYFIACVATAMLFGVVSGHFRVGRELHMWPVQPRFWQIHPLDRESLGQRQPSAWLQSSDDENNKEGNSEEQR